MAQGKYTVADIKTGAKPMGRYTVADIVSPGAPSGGVGLATGIVNGQAPDSMMTPPPVPGAPLPPGLTGPSSPNYAGMALTAGNALKDTAIGALKGAGSTLNNLGNVVTLGATSRPALKYYNQHLGTHFNIPTDAQEQAPFTPTNTAQSIGKGIEQAGEFLLPGLGEEAAGAKLAEAVPGLGKAAIPLARIGVSAVGSGAVNKLQGGGFGTGALLGAVGGAAGEGLRAVAPSIAESALKIRKLDRAYKPPGAIGRAILNETTGITPGAVAESAQGVLNELNPALDAAADRASVRPNAARGLLTAPQEDIPLHSAPYVEGSLSEPVRLTQIDRPGRKLLQAPSLSTPTAPGLQDVFPERLASADTQIRPTDFGANPGMGQAQYIGQIPGERGGPGMVQGVLRRSAPVGNGPIPSLLPNPTASLSPARSIIDTAIAKAVAENASKRAAQLQPASDFLRSRFASGDPIPESITPRDLLNLRRGFGDEFVHNWNPETMPGVTDVARKGYHALTDELHNVAPETLPLDRRISALIPVAKRAASTELNAPLSQRLTGRLAAHTGALTGAVVGGVGGYEHGGPAAALKYGAIGLVAPELLASPAAQMFAARSLNSPVLRRLAIPAAAGGALQLTRRGSKEDANQ